MKKLKLDVETLEVQSFDTAGVAEEHGTVHGAQYPTYPYQTCREPSCRVRCGPDTNDPQSTGPCLC